MAWWGTWWHVFPIKSLIQHIYKHSKYSQAINKIVRFWEKKSLEQETFQILSQNINHDNLYFQSIISWKYRRETRLKSRLKNIHDALKFIFWIIQSLYYIKKHHIDIIFCKGGYVALPVVLAWKLLKKKIIVHESDVHSWLVNKIAAKYADVVFTWFSWVLPKSKTIWQILSDDIVSTQSTKNIPNSTINNMEWKKLTVAEQLYYTDPDKTHILISGWSQWSKRLYKSFLESIKSNKETYKDYEIFIILWRENQDMRELFDNYQNIHLFDFITQQEMWLLLKNCDIALTRAGTTSLAEQKLYNLKIIMVPIPRTHDQYDNAKFYVRKYKDILLDSKLDSYTQDMLNIFKTHKNFKKQSIKKDILNEISKVKNVILDSIIKTWQE